MHDNAQDLTPAEYVERTVRGETWLLIDVREPWEHALASVAEAMLIPMGDVPARVEELDRSLPVAVLCHSGIRSAQVAGWLRYQGFDRVANIEGGIDAWSITVDASIPRY
jgi:rhodanese-related sulfurtransferase